MPDPDGKPRILTAYRLARYALPIVPAPLEREWMSNTDQRFANRCLPMLIANQSGWQILNGTEFTATWSGGPRVDATSILYGAGSAPPLVGTYFGYGIVTWSIPFLFRTPAGFNLLVRGPINEPKDGASPLEGVVESDWASATFTMNWKITRPGVPIRFAAGEPICLVVPQRRGELEEFAPEIRSIASDSEIDRQHRSWQASRYQFLRNMGEASQEDGPVWQRDYFQGRRVGEGEGRAEHQTRLHLRPFKNC